MLKPLFPRIEFTKEQLQHTASAAMISTSIPSSTASSAADNTNSKQAVNSIVHHSEFMAMVLGFMSSPIRTFRSFLSTVGITASEDSSAGIWECPNTQLVLTCWEQLNIRPSSSSKGLTDSKHPNDVANAGSKIESTSLATATCRDLAHGADTLRLGYYHPGTKQVVPVTLRGDILIRTR